MQTILSCESTMSIQRKEPEPVIVFAELISETEKAFKLSDGVKSEWVPKSQVKRVNDGVYAMAEWVARKKGFV
jgi:hypothetical protein